jgi:hypothetical protein
MHGDNVLLLSARITILGTCMIRCAAVLRIAARHTCLRGDQMIACACSSSLQLIRGKWDRRCQFPDDLAFFIQMSLRHKAVVNTDDHRVEIGELRGSSDYKPGPEW